LQARLARLDLGRRAREVVLEPSEPLLRSRDLLLEGEEALAADQVAHIGEEDQDEQDERDGRGDVGERRPHVPRAVVGREQAPAAAHAL
jgi:hypothetical protein